MKLELKDMQISKGEVIQGKDGDDLKHDDNILNPTSFALIIKRNLSSGWYKEIPELDISGRLKSIVVSIKRQIKKKKINCMNQFFPLDESIRYRLSVAHVYFV